MSSREIKKGTWVNSLVAEAAIEMENMPSTRRHNASVRTLELLSELAAKLELAKQFEGYDSHLSPQVKLKSNFYRVDMIVRATAASVAGFSYLPDASIMVCDQAGGLRNWSKTPGDVWRVKDIIPSQIVFSALSVGPDRSIFAGNHLGEIFKLTQHNRKFWEVEKISELSGAIKSLYAVSADRLMCVCFDRPPATLVKSKNAALSAKHWHINYLNHIGISEQKYHLSLAGIVTSTASKIRVWMPSKNCEWIPRNLEGHEKHVTCIHGLSNGGVVSASDDRTIRIWNKGRRGKWDAEIIECDQDEVTCIRPVQDGRIFAGTRSGNIIIYTRTTEGEWAKEVIDAHTHQVTSLQILPDGRIVSGSLDNRIKFWDGGGCA